jgi:hypothetical protein
VSYKYKHDRTLYISLVYYKTSEGIIECRATGGPSEPLR